MHGRDQRLLRHPGLVGERGRRARHRGAEEFEYVAGDDLAIVVHADHVIAVLQHHHARAAAADLLD